MIRDVIIQEIHKERARQDKLHPDWFGNEHGLAVLMEEVGESAKGLYEMNVATQANDQANYAKWRKNLKEELIQVAAVCVRWSENI